MAKVLCFGSLNIDYVYKVEHFVKKGETISSTSLNVFSGGKGLNQSVALGKAGCNTYHAGMIGQDGTFLLDVLKDAGVNTSLTLISDTARTGNAIIQNDSAGDNCIILYPGSNRQITEEMVDMVLDHFEKGDYLILQNEINKLDYITQKAKELGMIIVLNPSPFDEKLTMDILKRADWMVLNEVEASQLTGCDSYEETLLAAALRKSYPDTCFVLTLGINGSCCITAEETVHQDIYPAKTVDTTAAGDTFLGYFVSGLISEKHVKDCMDMAAKASSITVSREGAAPSIPWMHEIDSNF